MLVTLSLGLLIIVGAVFTRVIAARVPEQRATLEKLIADRTGLEVRFDNVHFAWGLDGTSAVFERVELTDPVRGRVRVVAPELRVEFDTWDFLKHQQFSLGHVKLASPDIEIIGDPEPAADAPVARRPAKNESAKDEDEATAIRRFITWAELMPIGRVEVEGARVHLLRRGDRAPRHSFTLSQANLSRGTHNINGFGTMLLSQDIGQSLFISTKLDNLGSAEGVNGEVRLIARRVLLDKVDASLTHGRGTLDATLVLRAGRIHTGNWQASARDFEFARGSRFDHFTVKGSLKRADDDLLIDFNDLQVTRGARLERAPRLAARVSLAPGSTRVARTSLEADRVPFMAAEFIAALLAPQLEQHLRALPADWSATAGELRAVRLDSAGGFRAEISGAEITRGPDRARIAQLAATIELQKEELKLRFEPAGKILVWLPGIEEPRGWQLEGELAVRAQTDLPRLAFTGIKLTSGEGSVAAEGEWTDGKATGKPLALTLSRLDRMLLDDIGNLLVVEDEVPRLADIQQGQIVAGQLHLVPALVDGKRGVDWRRSRGSLTLADLSAMADEGPQLSQAAGKLEFSRGNTTLRLDAGRIDDLELRQARIDWPRQGAPRLQAALAGELQSPLLQRLFAGHGMEKLSGNVTLDADARGEQVLQDPKLWRVTARVSQASIPLGVDLPPIQELGGTVRYADGQLRGVTLEGEWLGGPVKLDTRRISTRGPLRANISGTADAEPLLSLLGQPDTAALVNGKMAWTGTLLQAEDHWQVSLNSNLAGVESRLPEPFDKPRARQVALQAELRVDGEGIREFEIGSGRDAIRGRVNADVTTASFDVQGVAGELVARDKADPRLMLEPLELRRAPLVLAAAGAMLTDDARLALQIAELRHDDRSLGALRAAIARRGGQIEYSLQSADGAPHEIAGNGSCDADRCSVQFRFETENLPTLIAVSELPAEWPAEWLRASGELEWPRDAGGTDLVRRLAGTFALETRGRNGGHQMDAAAALSGGQIELSNVQGTGPAPDELFRGSGRIALLARTYDVTVDYERISLAATAVPSPARAGFARAWSALRGSAARRGWTEEATPPRRVQWHGSWE